MLTFQAARKLILGCISPCGSERVSVLDAVGRVLSEDILSPWDMPAADNSAMDGFAVIAGDCPGPTVLPVVGVLQAGGDPPAVMVPGTAVRIMTGACIPAGCDAVVPIEETEDLGGRVKIAGPVKRRQHIRVKGEDVATGERILAEGTLLRSSELSMLASCGKALVPVYRRPRVAILSTGDELVDLGEPLTAGKIINSNAVSLAAAVREAGADPWILGIARDDEASHRERMREGLLADGLITSAGVSAGDHDHVRDVLEELGVTQRFWKVAMKPGGPTAFATTKEGKPVFSLPGNPVSTMVTFEIFVRPALLRMQGRRRVVRPTTRVRLAEDVRKKPGKVQFIRLRLERDGARSSGDQNTGILKTMILADAMAVLPIERDFFKAGEEVDAILLRDDLDFLEA